MTKLQVIQRWFSEVWEQGNADVLDDLIAPSVAEDDELDGLYAPRSELPELVSVVRGLLPTLKVEILQHLESDDRIAVEYLVTDEGTPGRDPVSASAIMIVRFEDGKIADLSTRFDSFSLFEQLGQLPQDALLACLAGQELTWKK